MIAHTTLKENMEKPHSSKSIPSTDESVLCKGPCRKKTYASNSFLDHLKKTKRCRLKYTADEISDLQISSELKADAKREDTTLVSYIKVKDIINLFI